MPSDPAAGFADLQKRYPGSKQIRSSQQRQEPPPPVQDDKWDAHPTVMNVGDQPTELFTIGDLAVALLREPATLRLWEERGHLPPADYRFPGQTRAGQRRLYTRKQVLGLIKIAQEEGLLDSFTKKVGLTGFPERARALFGTKT